MLRGKTTLFIDQDGKMVYAKTTRELREKIRGRISKMYITINDITYHIGYIVGDRWLSAYMPIMIPQSDDLD